MTIPAALSGTVPPFLALVRDLDGAVPSPVLCVDAAGSIHAAALPADSPFPGERLQGRSLDSLVRASASELLGLLQLLQTSGHARAELELPIGETTETYLVLVEPTADSALPPDELLPGIIDAAPLPMLGLSDAGRVVVANAACRALLGARRSDLVGAQATSLLCEADDAKRLLGALELPDGGSPLRARVSTRDGHTRVLELVVNPVYAGATRPVGWVVWLRDPARPTPGRQSEPLVHRIREVAHDVRSPLCSIRGFARLLEQDFGESLGALGCGYLERVRSNLDRLQGMIEGLLEVARPQEASISELRWVVPLDAFDALRAELKPELEARGIALVLPGDAPAIWADPTRFRQVVLNLVANAVQHMGDAPGACIEIQVEEREAEKVLLIRDNGDGLPEEQHSGILDLFARKGSPGGLSGLGLVIVQRIMEAHGGRIEVESAPGRGSSFHCSFPDPA